MMKKRIFRKIAYTAALGMVLTTVFGGALSVSAQDSPAEAPAAAEETAVPSDTTMPEETAVPAEAKETAVPAEAAVPENETPAATEAEPVTAVFSGTAVLNGKEMAGGEFSFDLKDASGAVIETVKNAADGKFAFSAVTFTQAGTYAYTVSEEKGGTKEDGIDYDGTVYNLDVTVTDDGSLHISLPENTAALNFVNTFTKVGPAYTTATQKMAAVMVLANGVMKDGQFTFDIKGKSENTADTLAAGTVKNDKNGKITLPEMKFDAPGTYVYTVAQRNGGLSGITYDKSVYTVTIAVKANEDESLTVESAAIAKDGTAVDAMVFTNTKAAAKPISTSTSTSSVSETSSSDTSSESAGSESTSSVSESSSESSGTASVSSTESTSSTVSGHTAQVKGYTTPVATGDVGNAALYLILMAAAAAAGIAMAKKIA